MVFGVSSAVGMFSNFTASEFQDLMTNGGESEMSSRDGSSMPIDNRVLGLLIVGVPLLPMLGGAWLLLAGLFPKNANAVPQRLES